MDRTILHCDLNNFYASVECLLNPELRDKPVAVSGDPSKRHGVVLAKNELAKKAGVKTGDVIWQAKQKEPALIIVPSHLDLYTKISNQVFEIYTQFTSQVEPYGPDECWLDCTGSLKLFGMDGEGLANLIRNTVKERTGLTISVGVSFNKTFAKMASDIKKPDATTVVMREHYKDIIWNLPVGDLLFSGNKTTAFFNHYDIKTVGDLAHANRRLLELKLGKNGLSLQDSALGLDDDPVREYHQSRKVESIGHGMTAARDLYTLAEVDLLIAYLADKVATRLRAAEKRAYGVHINVRRGDLSHKSKQKLISAPVCSARDITEVAKQLLREIWNQDGAIRAVSVSTYSLVPINELGQISFFDDGKRDKNERLENAIDSIRKKYGKSTITIAGFSGVDFLYDKNDCEDFLPFKR